MDPMHMQPKKKENTAWIVIGIVIGLLLISVALVVAQIIQPDLGDNQEEMRPPEELQPVEPEPQEPGIQEPVPPESMRPDLQDVQPEPDLQGNKLATQDYDSGLQIVQTKSLLYETL
jgi:hypothetical protein